MGKGLIGALLGPKHVDRSSLNQGSNYVAQATMKNDEIAMSKEGSLFNHSGVKSQSCC